MAVLALQTKKSWAEKHILFGEKILSSTFKKKFTSQPKRIHVKANTK